MKTTLFLFLTILFSTDTFAQLNKIFPVMRCETADRKTVNLPEDTKGKYTFIGMAYSEKAEENLRSWYQPIYNKFIAKTGLMDSDYDVNICFVPMFTGGKKALKNSAIAELIKSDNAELHPYILFYAGELEFYNTNLSLIEKDKPYFFLLDKNGIVIFLEKGQFSEGKLERVEELIN